MYATFRHTGMNISFELFLKQHTNEYAIYGKDIAPTKNLMKSNVLLSL